MPQHLGYVTLVVRDYDEAIAFFTQALGFVLVEDSVSKDRAGREKRWVLVAPPGSGSTKLLLAKSSSREEARRIGNRPEGVSSCSFIPTTSGEITAPCRGAE